MKNTATKTHTTVIIIHDFNIQTNPFLRAKLRLWTLFLLWLTCSCQTAGINEKKKSQNNLLDRSKWKTKLLYQCHKRILSSLYISNNLLVHTLGCKNHPIPQNLSLFTGRINLRYLSDPEIVRILLLKMSLLLKAEDLHTLLISSGVRGDDVRNDLAIVLLCVTTLDTRDSSGSHNIKCWYL